MTDMVKLEKTPAELVTDAQRIEYAVTRLRRWASNFEANSQRCAEREDYDAARDLIVRANDIRDVISMLDGSDDDYISRLGEWSVATD